MFAGDEELGRDSHGLTEYELERIAHIRRNREIMRRLGLGDHDIVSAARQRCGHDISDSDCGEKTSNGKKKRTDNNKRRRDGTDAEGGGEGQVEGGMGGEGGGGDCGERVTRRSRRLAGNTSGEDDDLADEGEEGVWRRRGRGGRSVALDAVHEAEAVAYNLRNAGVQRRVSIVGTASYQHTLMRVRSMGEAALSRRCKTIERAKVGCASPALREVANIFKNNNNNKKNGRGKGNFVSTPQNSTSVRNSR